MILEELTRIGAGEAFAPQGAEQVYRYSKDYRDELTWVNHLPDLGLKYLSKSQRGADGAVARSADSYQLNDLRMSMH
jgi:hypothetical protein